jgi:hypothetical protein
MNCIRFGFEKCSESDFISFWERFYRDPDNKYENHIKHDRLNELISALSKDDTEEAYSAFYRGIHEYRKDSMSFTSGRMRIATQRKRDWQRRSARDMRDRRHK